MATWNQRRRIEALCAWLYVWASSGAIAAESIDPPTRAEIGQIEAHIDMPGDAGSIDEYVRFYYVDAEQQQRVIEAGYVANYNLESLNVPADHIVIVRSYEDVPAPYDAGCGVIRVRYFPQRPRSVEARCDPGLELFPQPSTPGWMFALIPLAPFGALVYFGITRWLPNLRTRKSDTRELSSLHSETASASVPPNKSLERTREG